MVTALIKHLIFPAMSRADDAPPTQPAALGSMERTETSQVLHIGSSNVSNGKTPGPESSTESGNPIHKLMADCYAAGVSAGLGNPDDEPDEMVAQGLVAMATRATGESARTPEVAALIEQDLKKRYEVSEQDAAFIRRDLPHTRAWVRMSQDKLAHCPLGDPPSAGSMLRWSAAGVLMVSVGPTLHDMMPRLPESIRWLFAIALGLAFGLALVTFILPADEVTSNKENTEENGVSK